nr:hypothetical protein [Clostridia bacterium]
MTTECIEDQLREEYCRFRAKRGKKNIFKEVPVFSRSVDLVEFDAHSRKITAVEFKVSDWKRAIKQLLEVAACFDYLVLCYPKPKTEECRNNIRSRCDELGIGLLLWDKNSGLFLCECKPASVFTIWKVQKKRVISYICNFKENGYE